MLQVYSSNLTVDANSPFALNTVALEKGCGTQLVGSSTIELNKRGVYLIKVDGFATPDAATEVTVQLYVNGIAQPQAISSFVPAAITDTRTFGFTTFVRALDNNCPCNCMTSPTTIQIMNGATSLTDAHVNVIVTQIR